MLRIRVCLGLRDVDEAGLRGKPVSVVRDAAGMMQGDPQLAERVGALAEMCEEARAELSPEADILL